MGEWVGGWEGKRERGAAARHTRYFTCSAVIWMGAGARFLTVPMRLMVALLGGGVARREGWVGGWLLLLRLDGLR